MHFLDIVATVYVIFSFTVHGLAKPCGTQMLTASSGEFSSPGYLNSLELNAQRCRFVIKAEPGNFVEINFTKFELKSPHKGRRTEFVKIIDKFGKPPAKVVFYDGIKNTPFTFVSQTRRVTVVLKTNGRNRGRGFHATYRQITPVLKDPVYCEYPDVENGWGECEYDDEEDVDEMMYDYCNITCDFTFQLVGNKTTKCNTDIGEWTDLPQCAMRPDVLETCLKDITNEDCLYSAETLTDHYMKETPDEEDEKEMVALIEELGDELRDFEVKDVPSIGRSPPSKQMTCPNYLCTFNSSTQSFVYICPTFSYRVQKKRNLNENQRKNWMLRCFDCQNKGCGTIQIFL